MWFMLLSHERSWQSPFLMHSLPNPPRLLYPNLQKTLKAPQSTPQPPPSPLPHPPRPPPPAPSAIDKDGNGVLSHQEITEALSDFGLSDSEITSVIQEVDADGNGEIDYDEFLTMMR